jgi:hypothetical protein
MNTTSPNSPHGSAGAESIGLRDMFAGQVLAAMIVAPRQPGVSRLEMEDMAKMSYQYADAMLKIR